MKASTQTIPDILIYEMDDGQPIYYRGYKDYLKNKKQLEQVMGSSYLQGVLITQMIIVLSQLLDMKQYRLISSEIGLQFEKGSWRNADIAIYKTSVLKGLPLNNKCMNIAPEVVIEIDTKADFSDDKRPSSYYQKKTAQLLDFGVQKVIWIFTDTKKVMLAAEQDIWQIFSWNKEIHVVEDATINVAQLLEDLEIE